VACGLKTCGVGQECCSGDVGVDCGLGQSPSDPCCKAHQAERGFVGYDTNCDDDGDCKAGEECCSLGGNHTQRLCGKIGGGSNGFDDYADATKSQWFNACTSGGQNVYPYGDAYSSSVCNGDGSGTVPVGSEIGCQSSASGYAGVYDLSGNVWEWEDSCSANSGSSDHCRFRGGSFDYFYGVGLDCDSVDGSGARGDRGYFSGVRCCAP
jgi:sulfatase modifying factor 1